MDPSGGSSSPSSPSTPSAPPGASYTVGYAYGGEFLSNITYPDSTLIHYGYDTLGRPVSVSSISGPVVTTYANIAYNKNSQITYIGYNNLLQANYTYDSLGRTSTITLMKPGKKPVTLLSLNYQYNKTSTVASVTGSVNSLTVNEQYSYDPLSRLSKSVVTSNGAISTSFSYQYDPVGNMVSQTVSGQTTSYTYNATNNELKSSTGPGGTTYYSYDSDGNLVGKTIGSTSWAYVWNAAGDLVKATKNGALKGAYAYDAQNRRVESTESSTIFYAYAGTETLYEYNGTSKTSNDYLSAAGILLGSLTAGTISFYHEDALGSVRLVTNPSASAVFADGYQPFGQDNGIVTGSQAYRFTGKPVSQTTGLYYDYQRWYDPSIGRFFSQDALSGSLSDPQSLNRYTYARNAPTVLTDPTGLMIDRACPDTCGGSGGVADVLTATIVLLSGGDLHLHVGLSDFVTGGPTRMCYGCEPGIGYDTEPYTRTEPVSATNDVSTSVSIKPPRDDGLETAEGGEKLYAESTGRQGLVQYGPGPSEPGWGSRYATLPGRESPAEVRADLSFHSGNPATYVRDVVAPKGSPMWKSQVRRLWGQPGGGVQFEVEDASVWIVGPWRIFMRPLIATVELY